MYIMAGSNTQDLIVGCNFVGVKKHSVLYKGPQYGHATQC